LDCGAALGLLVLGLLRVEGLGILEEERVGVEEETTICSCEARYVPEQ
jgi:hypothetical protein